MHVGKIGQFLTTCVFTDTQAGSGWMVPKAPPQHPQDTINTPLLGADGSQSALYER